MNTAAMPRRVRIVEVGPRDGLQNEAKPIGAADKVRFIEMLADAGLGRIEAASFVNPKWVPQMADAAAVLGALRPRSGVVYSALVPNERGLDGALAADLREIAVFTAASDSFNRKNIHCDVDASFDRFAPVVRRALDAGVAVRGYVSTCFGCPYEGAVRPERVVDVARRLVDLGIFEVSVGDTIGVATPREVDALVARLAKAVDRERIALHFHDTRGTALANVLAGLEAGIEVFDSSAGGLGGCPYAPGASGNLATEDLIYMLDGLGIETGVDLARLAEASRFMAGVLGRALPSRYLAAGPLVPKGPVPPPGEAV